MAEKKEPPAMTPFTPEQEALLKASLRKKEKFRKLLEGRQRRKKMKDGGERVKSFLYAGAAVVTESYGQKVVSEPETPPRPPEALGTSGSGASIGRCGRTLS